MTGDRTDERAPRELTAERFLRDQAVERSLRAARAKAESRSDSYIRTAVEILTETGQTDFTVQDLVARSNTSLRSFYQHFGSKDELLLALVEDVLGTAIDQWRPRLAELNPSAGLRLIVDNVHGHTMSPRGAALNRALNRYNMHLAESRPDAFGAVLLPLFDVLHDVIERGVADGSFRVDVDPRTLAAVFMQTLVGAAQLNALHGVPGVPAPDTEVVWAFLHGGLAGVRPLGAASTPVTD